MTHAKLNKPKIEFHNTLSNLEGGNWRTWRLLSIMRVPIVVKARGCKSSLVWLWVYFVGTWRVLWVFGLLEFGFHVCLWDALWVLGLHLFFFLSFFCLVSLCVLQVYLEVPYTFFIKCAWLSIKIRIHYLTCNGVKDDQRFPNSSYTSNTNQPSASLSYTKWGSYLKQSI